MDITLSESGKTVKLKSYMAKDRRKIEEARLKIENGETTLIDFQDIVLKKAYPDENFSKYTSADLSELFEYTLKYSMGGIQSVKKLLAFGNGTTGME